MSVLGGNHFLPEGCMIVSLIKQNEQLIFLRRNFKMATFDYVEKWWAENYSTLVKNFVDDPEKILSSDNGNKKGTYLVSVKVENKLIPMYAGEAGADEEHDRSISDRLKEHFRIWLGGDTEYHTGVKMLELETGKMKFHIHIVGEAESLESRKKMETNTITKKHPYLQYGPYTKYASRYDGLDLCIIPWNRTRRKALLNRLEQEGITVNKSASLIERILDKDFSADWKKCAKAGKEKDPIAYTLRQELKVGTDDYIKIKHIVDSGLGYEDGRRGCTYPFIIKVFSHALA